MSTRRRPLSGTSVRKSSSPSLTMKTSVLLLSHRKHKLQPLVDRGYAIHRQLTALNEEFKAIKDRLKAEALSRPLDRVPLTDTKSEGVQWIIEGKKGVCHIVFPNPRIKSDLELDHPNGQAIKSLTGDFFGALFRTSTYIEPVVKEKLREHAREFLPPASVEQLLDLCTAPSEPKAVWKERGTSESPHPVVPKPD